MASSAKPGAAPVSANVTLRDRGIAHAVQLERLKSGEAARVIEFYDTDVLPELQDKLAARLAAIAERGFDLGPETTARLEGLIEALTATLDAWTGKLSAEMAQRLAEIGTHEAEWQAGAINAAMPTPVRALFEAVVPAAATVQAAVIASPIDGVLLADIIGRLGRKSAEALEAEIRKGLVGGETIAQITARARDVTDLTRNSAEAVVRTAVGHASNVARQTTYSGNGDIIKGVQLVETLDTRTCLQCQALDGKVFPVDGGPRPPHHLQCRGSTVPVLKSLLELGFNAKDLPPGERASMNGVVSDRITFAEWIKTQPADIQDDALGPKRAALLRAGKLEVGDFVNNKGETITLDELKRRDPAAFRAGK